MPLDPKLIGLTFVDCYSFRPQMVTNLTMVQYLHEEFVVHAAQADSYAASARRSCNDETRQWFRRMAEKHAVIASNRLNALERL